MHFWLPCYLYFKSLKSAKGLIRKEFSLVLPDNKLGVFCFSRFQQKFCDRYNQDTTSPPPSLSLPLLSSLLEFASSPSSTAAIFTFSYSAPRPNPHSIQEYAQFLAKFLSHLTLLTFPWKTPRNYHTITPEYQHMLIIGSETSQWPLFVVRSVSRSFIIS